jgi:hypothetical protein
MLRIVNQIEQIERQPCAGQPFSVSSFHLCRDACVNVMLA